MSKKKLGLLPKLIIAIALGVIVGLVAPEKLIAIFATFNGIFNQFLGFVIPLIIIGFVVPGIADLGDGAGKDVYKRQVGIIVDINDDMIATQKLVDKTERDSLTNLYNKISAVRTVEQFLNKRNDDDNAAIFIIDVDDFKLVNDRYGHMFGDSVLSRISAQISSIFRGEDVIARIGGDEFLVMVCSSANDDYIETVASRIINCLKNASLDIPLDYNISCSVGAVSYTHLDVYKRQHIESC